MEKKLYVEIRYLDAGDRMYERVCGVFEGLHNCYCEGNSQPVIDYLSQWDEGEPEEGDFMEEEPYLAKGTDTSYKDKNGIYTLLYNSAIGGDFLLYREATHKEREWYYDQHSENE